MAIITVSSPPIHIVTLSQRQLALITRVCHEYAMTNPNPSDKEEVEKLRDDLVNWLKSCGS